MEARAIAPWISAMTVAGSMAWAAQGDAPPRVTAGRTDQPIHIDGVLDEPDWAQAGLIPDLTQQSPHPGEATPFRTEVRILTDKDTLYLGFHCFDPEPSKIASHTMQRDGELFSDDHVTIVLDTFGDRRTGYVFRVNALGARHDALIAPNGGGAQYPMPGENGSDWDGIWRAAARRTDDGWTAEVAIPSRTLRFAKGKDVWGFNVERTVGRERMDIRWSGITLDAVSTDLRRTGELAGVGHLRQGLGLSISPYGLTRSERDYGIHETHLKGDGGLDVAYNITPQLSAVFTVNTDFAETEVDTRQINLTRFDLFYPEKRQFFTDGSTHFDFGIGLDSDFIPFFSRRIGLYGDVQVPILGGVKLVGRQGRFGIGVLDVQTDDADGASGTNLFAGRATFDVDRHLRVGAIATIGDPDGTHDNQLGGVDAIWQTSTFRGDKNLSFGAWFAGSAGDVPEGQRIGYGFKAAYPNDLINASLSFKQFGDALDPALGFLPRPATRWYGAELSYNPRPRSGWWSTWVRQFNFSAWPSVVTDLEGTVESWAVETNLVTVQTQGGDRFEVAFEPQYEYLKDPFEVSEGVVIPAGKHQFNRFAVEAESASHRNWQLKADVSFGEFYTGTLTQIEASLAYKSSGGHLQLALETENAYGYLPEGDFIERLWQLRAVYSFNPDLVISAYAQYDTGSRNLGLNTRLRWTIQPGTDLYLVWNHGWERPFDTDRWAAMAPVADQAIIKLRYTWRR